MVDLKNKTSKLGNPMKKIATSVARYSETYLKREESVVLKMKFTVVHWSRHAKKTDSSFIYR